MKYLQHSENQLMKRPYIAIDAALRSNLHKYINGLKTKRKKQQS